MTDPLLAERVAVVTGAGQGIGREIARSLRAYGANVVLVDIDVDAAKAAAAEVDGMGMACDLARCARGLSGDARGEIGQHREHFFSFGKIWESRPNQLQRSQGRNRR